jgi:D-alanyl-D-alanine-carboxypeptidase/D-alanyl-D-alanine-endopeptidase
MHDRMLAAGALRSTAADLLRWLDACLRPPSDPPGPALALAQRPRVRAGRRLSLGLGWMVLLDRGRGPVVWHNGGTYGFRSFGAVVPGEGVAVVALTNSTRSLDRLGFAMVDAARKGA